MKKHTKMQPTKQFYKRLAAIFLLILLSTVLINAFQTRSLASTISVLTHFASAGSSKSTVIKPEITEDLLTPNVYSRPQTALTTVNAIVIHYVGNPGSTAKANRDYFESLAKSGQTSASSHFVIGTDGAIIQCIPLDEISYASNDRNNDTISIEVCHPDDTGKFTDESYNAVVELTAWLLYEYDLEKDDVIRHYDVTGKICPKYYVEHEDAWDKLKDDIWNYYQGN